MVAEFFRNAVFQVSLNLLVKGVYLFAVERTVQNVLPRGEYGLYFALLGLGIILQGIADFGLQLYNSRSLAGHRHLLAKYFPYFLGLKLTLGLAFFAVLLPLGYALGYRAEALGLLALAGGVQFFNSLVLYLRSNLQGLGRYRLDGWFSILDKSLMILTVGGLLWLAPQELTVRRFAGLQLLSWAVTAGLLVYVVKDRLPRRLPRFGRVTFLALLRGGAPFALAAVLATAYTRTDGIMIERLLADGAAASDHYAAGYRLLDALNTAGWLLAGLLLPMYARLYARGERMTELLGFSVALLVAGACCAAVPLAVYAGPVTELLYDFAEPRTGRILCWLALSFVAQCLNYAYGALLSATGHVGKMNVVYAAGVGLNVAGNLWALPRYGAPGAAAVTLLTQGFVAVTQAVLAHRWTGLPAGAVAWGRLLCFATLLGTCGRALLFFGAPYWLGLPALGLAGVGLLLALRLVDRRQLAALLRRGTA